MQNQIDMQNMVKIDSLFTKYQAYLGKSLVGEEFNHVMWIVIQHSPLEKQEQYLPIIQKAAKEDELPENPFKMLVDRIYAKKYGYQIFGSQGGIDLASDSVMQSVKVKYGIK